MNELKYDRAPWSIKDILMAIRAKCPFICFS